jgi:hypothetical protein
MFSDKECFHLCGYNKPTGIRYVLLCKNYIEMIRDCEVQFCKWLKLQRIQADDTFSDKKCFLL